ncbi:MAG: hypothetical protein O3C57_06050, partial [Verrucomicrobia bacterium]|nr:hypothetical protein [Verrucomicrobiota bacterium]
SGNNGPVRGALTVEAGATIDFAANNSLGINAGNSVNVLNILGGTVGGADFGQHYWNNFALNMTGGTLILGGNDWEFHNPTVSISASDSTAQIIGRDGNENFDIRSGAVTFDVANGSEFVDLLVDVPIRPQGGSTVIKNGAGMMRVTQANTYYGATTINEGLFQGRAGGASASSDVTVTPGASLKASLGVWVTTNAAQWTCKSLTTAGAGTPDLRFDFTVAPDQTNAPLVVMNAVTFTKTPTVTIHSTVGLRPGEYPLISWSSYSGTVPSSANVQGFPRDLVIKDSPTVGLYVRVPASMMFIIR